MTAASVHHSELENLKTHCKLCTYLEIGRGCSESVSHWSLEVDQINLRPVQFMQSYMMDGQDGIKWDGYHRWQVVQKSTFGANKWSVWSGLMGGWIDNSQTVTTIRELEQLQW